MSNVLRGVITNPDVIRGKSAYEIAVIHGFDGTEEEWIKSIEAYSTAAQEAAKQAEILRAETAGIKISTMDYANRAQASASQAEHAMGTIEQYKGLELVGTITLYPYSTEDGSKLYQEVERSGDTVAVYYKMDLSDDECNLFALARQARFRVSTYAQDIAVNSDFVYFYDGDITYYEMDMVDMVDSDVIVGDIDDGKAVYFKIDSVFKTVIDTFCAYSSDPLVIEVYK